MKTYLNTFHGFLRLSCQRISINVVSCCEEVVKIISVRFENIPIHDDHLYWFLFQLSWDAFFRYSRRKCLLHSSFCWVCPCLETWFNINEILSKTLSSLYSEYFFVFSNKNERCTLSWFWSCLSNNISIFFKSKKKKT